MERFVLDNSVVMSWCFRDADDGYADAVLERLAGGEALVPAVWPLEVANVLVAAERRGRLGEADSARFLRLLNDLPISVLQEPPARVTGEILALAREVSLSAYDASYLDLAMREGVPLATRDEALGKAARRLKVPLVEGDAVIL
jgi:predicted nucleic acid-binding protein